MLVFIVIFCVIIALGFGLASSWSDFRGLTISNIYPLGILVSFIPAYLLVTLMVPDVDYFFHWKSHLIAFGAVFAFTFLLFSLNMIGAADSKLAAVYALWVGLNGLFPFIVCMALTGGVLGLIALALKKWKPVKSPHEGGWVAKSQAGISAVPYGIAITAGAFAAFAKVGYTDPDKLSDLATLLSSASF